MSPPLTFISLLRPWRSDFIATMTTEEKAVMDRHLAYIDKLAGEGKVIIAGAATDGSVGILVFQAGSAEEAQQILDDDPVANSGIGQLELHPFWVGIHSSR
jgi:uncharacterized protein YciI